MDKPDQPSMVRLKFQHPHTTRAISELEKKLYEQTKSPSLGNVKIGSCSPCPRCGSMSQDALKVCQCCGKYKETPNV